MDSLSSGLSTAPYEEDDSLVPSLKSRGDDFPRSCRDMSDHEPSQQKNHSSQKSTGQLSVGAPLPFAAYGPLKL